MIRPRPFYFLRRAVLNLWGAPLPAAVTAATIAIVVFLFGAFLLTGQNTYQALVGWAGAGDPLVVYAKRGLPAAISVGLRDSSLDPGTVGSLAARLRHFEGVEMVDSELVWVERFAKLGRALRWIGAGWGAILGFGALLVIGNSTRLAALTRKDEIEVLRLVGASEAFIIVPFFIEGALQGLFGSAIGLGLLAAAFFGLRSMLAGDALLGALPIGLHFLEPWLAGLLMVAGPLLGAIGAVGSARRFLSGIEL